MKECSKCKSTNNDNAYSCYNCGETFHEAKLTNAQIAYNSICRHCGSEVKQGNKLCIKCKVKKILLILATLPLVFIISFIVLLIINLPLVFLFEIKTGYVIDFVIMTAIFSFFSKQISNKMIKPNVKYYKAVAEMLEGEKFEKVQKNKKEEKGNVATQDITIEQNPITKNKFCKKCGNPLDDYKKCKGGGKQYFYPRRYILEKQSKYCKECGGLIDVSTRKCVSCEKKYFDFSKLINLRNIIICFLILTVPVFIFFIVSYEEKEYVDDLIINKSNAVRTGYHAYVRIKADPLTKYDITVKKGWFNGVDDVQAEVTDSYGLATWSWRVDDYATPGDYIIRIENDTEYTTTTIKIYE